MKSQYTRLRVLPLMESLHSNFRIMLGELRTVENVGRE